MNIKSILILIGFILLNESRAQKKGCDVRKLENQLMPFVGHFGYREHRWPQNDNQMTEHCKTLSRSKASAKNYTNNCLKGATKSVISIIVFATERLNRLPCKNDKERDNYIEMGKCGNKAKKGTTSCWKSLINILVNLKYQKELKDKVGPLCCSFYEWKDCTMAAYRTVGSPHCGERVVNNLEGFIDRMAIDAMRLLCSEYEESDRCDKVYPTLDRTPNKEKYRTPFPVGLQIIDNL